MTRDSLEIHQWISTVHSFIEITLKVTILQNVIIFSYMLWKILLGVLHIMARMKRLVWLLDHKLHWLLFKVLMAQEGDRVPAVEGQVCLVRWVSCGDREEQISISQNTKHALITCRIRPSQFIERKPGKMTKRFSRIVTTSIWATELSTLRGACTYLQSKETWPLSNTTKCANREVVIDCEWSLFRLVRRARRERNPRDDRWPREILFSRAPRSQDLARQFFFSGISFASRSTD